MRKKWKFVIGGAIILVAVGFLAYRGFMASASYYYELGEFMGQQSVLADKTVRISGQVATGSIDQKGLSLKFVMTDGQRNLPVVYQGAVPDTFKAGSDVTVEGRLDGGGTFVAQTIMPKCPSRYVAQ